MGCESIWKRGLLTKGHGLCHGAAGNALALAAAYQGLQQVIQGQGQSHQDIDLSILLKRVATFGQWCLEHDRHRCPPPDQPDCLMNGAAGVALFLAELMAFGENPDHLMTFPCFQISQI